MLSPLKEKVKISPKIHFKIVCLFNLAIKILELI